MSTSSQTYKELGIPYYLIGASAIDLQLLGKGIRPKRATKDIDFAVMVSSLSEYERMRESLETRGFRKLHAPWTFRSAAFDVTIDMLPFGAIEGTESLDLHVLGFREVMEDAEGVHIEERIAHVPALPGMILLKLIAWSDRPEERGDDLPDILRIMSHYFDLDDIAENHFDLLDADPFDERMIAAEVLGRECRTYLERSDAVAKRVMKVIGDNLQEPSRSALAREWARKADTDIEYAFTLLQAFHRGIS